MTETITISPNYQALFGRLIREVEPYTKRLIKEIRQVPVVARGDREYQQAHVSDLLQSLNGLMYAVSLCASSMTTRPPSSSSITSRFSGAMSRQSAAVDRAIASAGSVAPSTGAGRQKV